MQLVNMNIKSDAGDKAEATTSDYDPSPCVYLNDEQVAALGISGLPKPGTVYHLQARAVVRSVNASDYEGKDKPDVSVSLCLTDIGLQGESPDRARMLYGE